MKFVVAQLGARMHYAVPRILNHAGMLERLYTDIYVTKSWQKLIGLIPSSIRPSGVERLLGRAPKDIPADRIKAFNRFGLEFVGRLKASSTTALRTRTLLWADDRFSDLVLQNGLWEADAIYGFNTGCSKLYRGAKQKGFKIVVEQFIAPILVEKQLIDLELLDSEEWDRIEQDDLLGELIERELETWSLADIILCGSEFVRQGVIKAGGPGEKCFVVPYGVELSDYGNNPLDKRENNNLLRVLFVGGVNARKGVRYLLDAMCQLEGMPIQCRIVGSLQLSKDIVNRYILPNVEFVGLVPRADVAYEYSRADVFCLPSLCEGSATVIYEALASGLPVITTHNAGSIVRDGQEGFIVPIQDSRAIANSLKRLASDRGLLRSMSLAARKRSSHGSLEAYGQRLIEALSSLA